MERRAINVQGIVQGVGFRPFVHGLASRLQLAGFVRNEIDGVMIEIEGAAPQLDDFVQQLTSRPPPLARIERIICRPCPPLGETDFQIGHSKAAGSAAIFIAPDAATCPDCVREMCDPADRRHGYPFLNCTNCGPRLTIIRGAPYDRANTTMADFAMCENCHREYCDPANRRFHAQPTACPACGPRLQLIGADGQPIHTAEPIAALTARLRAGCVAAVKGLGGFHLACDATNAMAVRALRLRKHREEKPFAIMVANVQAVASLCELDDAEQNLLQSPQAPIVLLRKRAQCPIAAEVAPGNPMLGVMLPCTPLHHLLMAEIRTPLVMTSGNQSDEPIATGNDDATRRLRGIADVFLVHNRSIHVRCDDSVIRIVDDHPLPIRRSRGYSPQPISLPAQCAQPMLAVGGHLKSTFALGRGQHAFVSHHLGDLDHYQAYCAFERDIQLYEQLFAVAPQVLVHDLHPDYASTRYARQRAAETGAQLLSVQHHHAHMASCMAEHNLSGPVIGVCFDGAGLGTDGTIWGGEFLIGGYESFTRAAHLRETPMPGGEKAVREPWRMAAAHAIESGLYLSVLSGLIPANSLHTLATMIERDVNCPRTSSAGRLFDAVASLCGIRQRVSYEGQAAIELEWLAAQLPETPLPAAQCPHSLTIPTPFKRRQPAMSPLRMWLTRGRSFVRWWMM